MSFFKSLPEGAQSFDVFASRPDVYALHDAVVVACIAGFMNRFVFGLGIDSEDAYREAAGRAVEQEGYLPRFQERLSTRGR